MNVETSLKSLMNPTSEVASSDSDFRPQSASSTSAPQGDGTVSSSTKSAEPLETNQGFDKDEGQHPTVAIISASIFGVMIVIFLAVIIHWFWRRRREKPSVVSFDREIMILNKGGSDYGHRNLLGFKSSKSRLNTTQSYDPPDRTDRQMFIQEKIKELRQQMVSASNKGLSSAREVEALRATIKKWEDMQSSEWELETD
ncbi:hypothetical protein K435DRAFT_939278 [Dendrothele bispora CBS 962.96]|uniref:Uncharacterized protein n=1 Tax=Dendrothele bispora (strain CBS 962.96) TaxID=1314807 RepID=A0A4V4HGN1_DENBC|nr:hypothetical protein K435DRAFT_939278 [Dendrothele bispora CBS 962.96]